MHTLFRIFDASRDQITAIDAQICFKSILVEALSANQAKFITASESAQPGTESRSWNETTIVLIEGTTKLFSQWLDAYIEEQSIATMWAELLNQLENFLGRQSLGVSKTTFTGLSNMLSEIESPNSFAESSIDKCWKTLQSANPVSHTDDSKRRDGNQDALLAYLSCLSQMIRLTKERLPHDRIEMALAQLRICITGSTASAYNSDVDRMTTVQIAVFESLKAIPTELPAAAFELANCITFFTTLAYEPRIEAKGDKQTYLALSKASMSLLESFVAHHLQEPAIDPSDLLTRALIALSKPMHLKYEFQPEGKAPSPWRKSISTATGILETSRRLIERQTKADKLKISFWDALVDVIDGIVAADCEAIESLTAITQDRDSDVAAFLHIRNMITPALGSSSIPDAIRKRYADSIFHNSLIHEPHPDDLARPGQDLLEGLRSDHIGRVQDLTPSPRSKLSYLLLDELFDLVAVHDRSAERVALAQAAAPYLILRAGLTLKAYIYEQPLRGRMPQPWSQKEEMLYILRKLTELESEPKAIPATLGVTSKYKKHLHRLFPFLMKAMKAARRDEEMADALREVLVAVGDDFGV